MRFSTCSTIALMARWLANGNSVDYAKHFVDIKIAEDHFSIADNCGGIPRDVAKNYAFKMGANLMTTAIRMPKPSVYGVGMKRDLQDGA